MDDATRLTLAMRPFVSRFIQVKKRSRFSSRRILSRSQRNVGASPFSTSVATSLSEATGATARRAVKPNN